jgi:hypothetical protein
VKNPAAVLVIEDDNLPDNLPRNVVIRSWDEAEKEMQEGTLFIRFKKYIGSGRSGSTPWAIIRQGMNHHIILGYHESLERAVRFVLALRRGEDAKRLKNFRE